MKANFKKKSIPSNQASLFLSQGSSDSADLLNGLGDSHDLLGRSGLAARLGALSAVALSALLGAALLLVARLLAVRARAAFVRSGSLVGVATVLSPAALALAPLVSELAPAANSS
jgi:hypothetical protein